MGNLGYCKNRGSPSSSYITFPVVHQANLYMIPTASSQKILVNLSDLNEFISHNGFLLWTKFIKINEYLALPLEYFSYSEHEQASLGIVIIGSWRKTLSSKPKNKIKQLFEFSSN